MTNKNFSIARLYDYANYCAEAVYRFSRDTEQEIILYSMTPFFKLHFYQAYLTGDDDPNWEEIENNLESFVESGKTDVLENKGPIYDFFSEVVDGVLKEYDQRSSESTAYFKALAQISGGIRELIDSINNGEVELDDLVNQIMDRIIGALDEETVA